MTAVVAVLVGLIASLMVTLPVAADPVVGSGLCPKGGDGGIKVDRSSGTRTGDFGTFSWDDDTLAYDLNDGYAVEFCLKYATITLTETVSGTGELVTTTTQDISHISYRLTEPEDPTEVNATLSGKKLGEDGIDEDSEPDVLPGWTITIYEYDGNDVTAEVGNEVTDEQGEWTWIGPSVPEGTVQRYLVCEQPQDGWTQIAPTVLGGGVSYGGGVCHDVTATGDELVLGLDFTNHPLRSIGGSKHFKTADGEKIAGWRILVKDGNGVTVCDVTTNAAGDWTCSGLTIGTYTVTEVLLTGSGFTWTQVSPLAPYVVVLAPNEPASPATHDYDFVNDCTVKTYPGGRTIGFWGNKNGETSFKTDYDGIGSGVDLGDVANYTGLAGRNLRTKSSGGAAGEFNPGSYTAYKSWLSKATSTDAVYMLSAQFSATWLNVNNGDRSATRITNPNFVVTWTIGGTPKTQSISAWLTEANTVLGGTLPSKAVLEQYKNLFDAINNNEPLGSAPGTITTCGATAAVLPD